jgi:two-component system, response regulator
MSHKTRTILLVEDSSNDAELAKAAFRRSSVPHELIVTEDGVEALDYLLCQGAYANRAPALPEVMLLDLKLPGMDGFEVLRRIRSDDRTLALPVVVLTSSIEIQDLAQSYRLGVNSYVRKPIDFDEFLPLARELASYWLDVNHAPPERDGA